MSLNMTQLFETFNPLMENQDNGSTSLSQEVNIHTILHQVHTGLTLMVFVAGVIINSLVLLLFYRKPSVRSFSNGFVINMTVTHLLTCLLVTPFVIITSFTHNWIFGDVWCQITGLFSLTLNTATVYSIFLIAVDRYCAVNSPLHYSTTITKRRTIGLVSSVWFLSCISALPPLIGLCEIKFRPEYGMCTVVWSKTDIFSLIYSVYLAICVFLLPFVKMIWIYCSMFRAARSSSAGVRQRSLSSSCSEVNCGILTNKGTELRVSRMYIAKRRPSFRKNSSQSIFGEEWKAAKTGLIILMSFTFSWLPLFVTSLLESTANLNIPKYVYSMVIVLSLSSAAINPYIYVFRNKSTRKHLRKIVRCKNRANYNESVSSACHRRHLMTRRISSFRYSTPDCHSIHHRASDPSPATLQSLQSSDKTDLWRLVTYIDGGAQVEDKDHCVMVNDSEDLNKEGKRGLYDDETPGSSNERLLYKFRRAHRDSSASESTMGCPSCPSFDSVLTNDDVKIDTRYLIHQWEANNPAVSRIPGRPPLKRGRSVQEDQELNLVPGVLMSKLGKGRRNSYVCASRRKSQDSSETTLTSSASTESQDLPVTPFIPQRNRPKLIRQHSSVLPYTDVKSLRNQESYDEGRRNSVCYIVG